MLILLMLIINQGLNNYAEAFVNFDVNSIVSMYKFPCEIVHNGVSANFTEDSFRDNIEKLCGIYRDFGLSNAIYNIILCNEGCARVGWILKQNEVIFSEFTCEYYFDEDDKVYLVKNFDEKL